MKIGIIGAGKVGTAFAIVFKRIGFSVFIASKHSESAIRAAKIACIDSCTIEDAASANIVFLTVPDSEIVNVALSIKNVVKENQTIVHLSGALPVSIINFLNANVCSLHPLKSFADSLSSANTMEGTMFTFEGNAAAYKNIKPVVDKMNCKIVKIQSKNKPLYHLAAVIVANYTVTLFNISQEILQSIGFNKNEAKDALLTLLRDVINNIKEKDAESALTGPILRGDFKTIELHLAQIKDKNLKTIYKSLAFDTLKIAEKRGLDKKKIKKIREVLNG